jgi:hypothetical protein
MDIETLSLQKSASFSLSPWLFHARRASNTINNIIDNPSDEEEEEHHHHVDSYMTTQMIC